MPSIASSSPRSVGCISAAASARYERRDDIDDAFFTIGCIPICHRALQGHSGRGERPLMDSMLLGKILEAIPKPATWCVL